MIRIEVPAGSSLIAVIQEMTEGAAGDPGAEMHESSYSLLAGGNGISSGEQPLDIPAITSTLDAFTGEVVQLNAGLVPRINSRPHQLAHLVAVESRNLGRRIPTDERINLLESLTRSYDSGAVDTDTKVVTAAGEVVEMSETLLDDEVRAAFGMLAAVYGSKAASPYFTANQRAAFHAKTVECRERAKPCASHGVTQIYAGLGRLAAAA